MRIAHAASRLIAYDAGYRFPFGYTDLMNWDRDIEKLLAEGGQSVTEYFNKNSGGKLAYVDFIEEKHPGYLHELYRYATTTIGVKASFHRTAVCMNDRSRVPTESRDNINITRRQLNEWFNKNGGTEISPIEKPLDTTDHKIDD